MKEIYILAKPEGVERINEEVKKYQDIANVKVITDINEIPQDNGNGKIMEEYYEDELEFPNRKKMVSVDRVCKWLMEQEEMVGVSFQEDFYERIREEL